MLKFIVVFLLLNVFRIIFIDGILNDILAEYTYDTFPEFYVWAVYNKDTLILIGVAIIFSIIIYRFISKKVNELNKIYNAIDNVYDDVVTNIELPNSLWMFSDKLNKIKYEYMANKNKAKDAEQKKNDLIMYMAHDLKTPLTSVIGYLSLLNDEKNISKDLQEKYLKIALNKSMRVEELTNQFFEITRYNLQDMPINKNKIDLSLLLDQLIDESYPMMQKRNLKFNVTKPNNLSFVGDDEQRLIDSLRAKLEITDFIPDLTEEQIGKFDEFMDAYIDELDKEIAYYEQKFYKLGAAEIVTFLAECLMMKKL